MEGNDTSGVCTDRSDKLRLLAILYSESIMNCIK